MSQTANTTTILKGHPTPDSLGHYLSLLRHSLEAGDCSQVRNLLMVLKTRHGFARQWPGHIDGTGVAAAIKQAEDYLNNR